ncbi:siderophore ABC transporter substrate-binding protein [Culicoidibacter larvae]|nr:siderophore ABC transporter substrate-binding protein [Culicoidibacter larvae]
MNKKVMAIVLAIIVVLGAGAGVYYFMQGNNTQAAGDTEITHELGTVSVTANPQKVVVFDYGVLDSLNTLGVEVSGVVKQSLPTYLNKYADASYTDIGTLFEPNFEVLHDLKPDVIFISGRQKDLYKQLTEIAPTVYLTLDNSDYLGSFKTNMETIGKIFNKTNEVSIELAAIDGAITDLKQLTSASNKNALIVMANDGELSAYGESSRFGVIHNTFGVTPVDTNIETSTHGQSVGFEYVVEKNPDVIFVVDRNAVTTGESKAAALFDNDLMAATKAVKNNAIINLDAHTWYVASGGLQSTKTMIAEVRSAFE